MIASICTVDNNGNLAASGNTTSGGNAVLTTRYTIFCGAYCGISRYSLIQRKTVEPNDIDIPEGIVNKELDVNGSHSDKDHVVERGSSKSNNKGKTLISRHISELKFTALYQLVYGR